MRVALFVKWRGHLFIIIYSP